MRTDFLNVKQCRYRTVSSNFKSKLADIKPYDKVDAENTFLNVSLNLRHKIYDKNLEDLVTPNVTFEYTQSPVFDVT